MAKDFMTVMSRNGVQHVVKRMPLRPAKTERDYGYSFCQKYIFKGGPYVLVKEDTPPAGICVKCLEDMGKEITKAENDRQREIANGPKT